MDCLGCRVNSALALADVSANRATCMLPARHLRSIIHILWKLVALSLSSTASELSPSSMLPSRVDKQVFEEKNTAAMSRSGPLSELSPNTTSPTKSSTATDGHKGHSSTLSTMRSWGCSQQKHPTTTTYISPSDMIMSPTTKKLSEIKGKRFAYVTPSFLYSSCQMHAR